MSSGLSNNSARQQIDTSYVKSFQNYVQNSIQWIYQTISGTKYITLSVSSSPVIIQNNLTVSEDLTVDGTIYGTLVTPSDIKLKDNIKEIDDSKVNEFFETVIPKQYTFIKDKEKHTHYGFIAQELEKQFPELISIDNSKIKMVNYIEMIPLFIHKIKQMEREIEYLKNIE